MYSNRRVFLDQPIFKAILLRIWAIFKPSIMVIATRVTNNANPAMERPAVAQLHGSRTNEKQRCKLHYYVKLVDTLF